MAATKTKTHRKGKGERHHVHAQSLIAIGEQLCEHAKNDQVDKTSARALLRLIADVFRAEGKRVQNILR